MVIFSFITLLLLFLGVSEEQKFSVSVRISGEYVYEIGYLLYDVDTTPLVSFGVGVAAVCVGAIVIFAICSYIRENRLYKVFE